MTTTPEVQAALDRVTRGVYGPDILYSNINNGDLRTILSARAEAQASLDEYALFDAETDLAFKDLDATIADLREELATAEGERDAMREAAEPLLAACESEFGVPDENDEDEEAVGGSDDGPMAITFGMMRRLRAALTPTTKDADQ